MEAQFLAFLLGGAGVAALVGERGAWDVVPQGDGLPAFCLHKIASNPNLTLQGRNALTDAVVQIDCWGDSAPATWALAAAVRARLAEPMPDPLRAVFVEDERSSFEAGDAPRASDASDFHRTSLDTRVWFYL